MEDRSEVELALTKQAIESHIKFCEERRNSDEEWRQQFRNLVTGLEGKIKLDMTGLKRDLEKRMDASDTKLWLVIATMVAGIVIQLIVMKFTR